MSDPLTSTPPRALGRPFDETKSEQIVEAARACFFEKGFSATSIEEIARRANVSKVTVYNRFADKQTLFVECISSECQGMQAALTLDMDAGDDLRARLIHFGEVMYDFLNRPKIRQFDKMLGAEMDGHPELGVMFLNAGPRRMRQGLALVLQSAVDRGELAVPNIPFAAELLGNMIKGFTDVERRFDPASEDHATARERIAYAVDVFLKAHQP